MLDAAKQMVRRYVDRHPGLKSASGRVAAAAAFIGAVAALLGDLTSLKSQLSNAFGISGATLIHYSMAVVFALLVIVAYAAGGRWLYSKYAARLAPVARRACVLLASLIAIPMAVTTYLWALPGSPDESKFILDKAREWEKQLLSLDPDRTGGMKYDRVDPSVEKQVWVTAQSLTAILSSNPVGAQDDAALRAHFAYIHDKRLRGDEGWGYMTGSAFGITEIGAWVLLAHAESLRAPVASRLWPGGARQEGLKRARTMIRMLLSRQLANGAFSPLRVDNRQAKEYSRTYSTVMAVWALCNAGEVIDLPPAERGKVDQAIVGGIRWLSGNYLSTVDVRSWVPNPSRPNQKEDFIGLSHQVLFVLNKARRRYGAVVEDGDTFARSLEEFQNTLAHLTSSPLATAVAHVKALKGDGGASPPRLMGKKISANERMHDSDRYVGKSPNFIEASTFMWYPWAVALCASLQDHPPANADSFATLREDCEALLAKRRLDEMVKFVQGDSFAYVMAEHLFSMRYFLAASR